MIPASNYVALRGDVIAVASLTDAEQEFVAELKRQAKQLGEWTVYENYWIRAVADFYKESGLTQKQIRERGVYRIAQDLGSRLAVEAGLARVPAGLIEQSCSPVSDDALTDAEEAALLREAGRLAGWDDPEMTAYDQLDPRRPA